MRSGGSQTVPAALRKMRVLATGLLVGMAALYLVSRGLQPLHPAWGYVRAFAEAAMVGGLADWFAVTALFRHPLACRSRTPRSCRATRTGSATRSPISCAPIS